MSLSAGNETRPMDIQGTGSLEITQHKSTHVQLQNLRPCKFVVESDHTLALGLSLSFLSTLF